MAHIDLNDTCGCPVAPSCLTCGSDDDLAVAVGQNPVGVFCCTLCDDCALNGRLPVLSVPAAVKLSIEHCAHLGVNADQMRDAMVAEELAEAEVERRRRW
jgi:hypothetical protein